MGCQVLSANGSPCNPLLRRAWMLQGEPLAECEHWQME